VPEARAVLDRAQRETKQEWKVFLEAVLLEIRSRRIPEAIEQAQNALKVRLQTSFFLTFFRIGFLISLTSIAFLNLSSNCFLCVS
jgi:hypothetical protein